MFFSLIPFIQIDNPILRQTCLHSTRHPWSISVKDFSKPYYTCEHNYTILLSNRGMSYGEYFYSKLQNFLKYFNYFQLSLNLTWSLHSDIYETKDL